MKLAPAQSKTKVDPAEQRRRGILAGSQSPGEPVRGGELARRFRVSRQCLVQDVAILRAGGEEIEATPRGYHLPATSRRGHRELRACRHAPARTQEELQILVDHGVKILD